MNSLANTVDRNTGFLLILLLNFINRIVDGRLSISIVVKQRGDVI